MYGTGGDSVRRRLIGKGRFKSRRERFKYLIVELLSILDALIALLTLGYLTSRIMAEVLFSDWMEDND